MFHENERLNNMAINYRQLRQQYRKPARMPLAVVIGAIVTVFLIIMVSGCAYAGEQVDMSIIAQIESSNNSNAYNKRSGAIGLCQITPIVLKEFNQHFHKHYTKTDLFIEQVNILVADWYMNTRIPTMLSIYGIEDNIRNRLIAYNWGIGHLKNDIWIPQETVNYIVKYEELEERK